MAISRSLIAEEAFAGRRLSANASCKRIAFGDEFFAFLPEFRAGFFEFL